MNKPFLVVDDDTTQPTNRPPLQEQIDRLERDTQAVREALGHVMAAVIPAFQALEHLEAAARAMLAREND